MSSAGVVAVFSAGLVLGVLLTLVIVLVRQRLDTRTRATEDVPAPRGREAA